MLSSLKKGQETAIMSIKSEIKYFVVENFLYSQNNDFGDDVSFMAQGILDSTGILELVCFVEETYGIPVEDEEIIPENFDSIGKLTGFISSKISSGGIQECSGIH